MKVMITAKNYKPSERLQENIEKKFSRLGKYFHDDVVANVIVSKFKDKTKLEATINTNQTLFRAEEISDNVYEAIMKVRPYGVDSFTKTSIKLADGTMVKDASLITEFAKEARRAFQDIAKETKGLD